MKCIYIFFSVVLFFGCVTGSNRKINTLEEGDVLLRYAYRPGQAFKLVTDMKIDMQINGGFVKQHIKMDMLMDAVQEIVSVEKNGNFNSTIAITRIYMTVKVGNRTITIDTNDASQRGNRQFGDIFILLDKPIKTLFSSRGQVIKSDYSSIADAFKGRKSAFAEKIQENFDQMLNNTMVVFPEKPVTEGSSYDGGVISQKLPNMGKMNFYVTYTVSEIKDNIVYIKPVKQIELLLDQHNITADITDAEMDTVIRFDLAKGYIVTATDKNILDLQVKQRAMAISMTMGTETKFTVTEKMAGE